MLYATARVEHRRTLFRLRLHVLAIKKQFKEPCFRLFFMKNLTTQIIKTDHRNIYKWIYTS